MYYKEEWIDGKLYWKGSLNGEWIEFTKQGYAERLLKVQSELKNLQLSAVSGNEALRVALPKPTRDDYLQLANEILEEDITPRIINNLIDKFKEKFDWRCNDR